MLSLNPAEKLRREEQLIADTKILQKVNAAHRDAFSAKFPGQVEHCLRLVTERLQAGLDKRDGVVVDNSSTWKLNSAEIADLAEAAKHLHDIRKDL
jgi:hypothetical protein